MDLKIQVGHAGGAYSVAMNAHDIVELARRIPEVPGYVLTGFYAARWTVKRVMAWRRRHRPPAPTSILDHRMRMRAEIEEHMKDRLGEPTFGEVIIRDLGRINAFPDVEDQEPGISAWFKIELNGFYYRGIEVFLSIARKAILVRDEHGLGGGWRFVDEGEHYDEAITVWSTGRIPFEWIERIDWTPDDYDGLPHFYCRFAGPFGEPYEEIIYKGKLYPSVSQRYHECRGLRIEREDWGWLHRRSFFFVKWGERMWWRLTRRWRLRRRRKGRTWQKG